MLKGSGENNDNYTDEERLIIGTGGKDQAF